MKTGIALRGHKSSRHNTALLEMVGQRERQVTGRCCGGQHDTQYCMSWFRGCYVLSSYQSYRLHPGSCPGSSQSGAIFTRCQLVIWTLYGSVCHLWSALSDTDPSEAIHRDARSPQKKLTYNRSIGQLIDYHDPVLNGPWLSQFNWRDPESSWRVQHLRRSSGLMHQKKKQTLPSVAAGYQEGGSSCSTSMLWMTRAAKFKSQSV